LGPVLVRISLIRFVMADGAAGRRTQLAMAGHVASDSADDGSLDAPLCLGIVGGDERNGGNANCT
jgi:hypothetical protein